jgi:hypothetical protein
LTQRHPAAVIAAGGVLSGEGVVAHAQGGVEGSGGRVYRYELWYLGQLLAAGRFTNDRPLEPGDTVTIGVNHGVVREVKLTASGSALKLIVDLVGRQ